MGRKNKYTKETKLKAIQEYINGVKSISEISNKLECHQGTILKWVTLYKGCGESVFDDKKNNQSYSKEFKEQIVKEYLEGKGSLLDMRVKYNIFSDSTILNWISKYTNGIILTEYKPMSEVYTMKSRKVSYEERIEIVNYCLANDYDYKSTANKYNVPYSQVYTWVSKVKKNGYESLKLHKKGPKLKNLVEPKTSEELLELENERLRKENERLQLEVEVLKKKHRLQRRTDTQK